MAEPRIKVADGAGYCYGVERALKLTNQAAESDSPRPIRTFGPIIHNPAVVEELRASGVEVVEDLDDIRRGTLIIRSHGIGRELLEEASSRLEIVDATCPFVKKAQQCAARLNEAGYQVVIVGEPDHPEVVGIRSYAGPGALVIESAADLPEKVSDKVGIVVQTTQSSEALRGVVDALIDDVVELRLYNTICNATQQRQEGARQLAEEADVIVVVGGRNSANTTRLATICAETGGAVHHIETADELRPEWFESSRLVGITGGASTPQQQVTAVRDAVARLLR